MLTIFQRFLIVEYRAPVLIMVILANILVCDISRILERKGFHLIIQSTNADSEIQQRVCYFSLEELCF
ncbi:hypothetical protein DK843_15445 [Chromobacterium phragmitis]|uniref:Uncharacterized protein n=1 Tax=Chromobacterium phragmitis TaxID=2202141 RepID=A0A344UJY3_9NEIS|nr:hypothetical protein DK843_15445 [Chromobacterium phragmitis]